MSLPGNTWLGQAFAFDRKGTSMSTILIIVLIVLLLGGGGYYGRRFF